MSITAWIVFAICVGWVAFAYYFLFAREKNRVTSSGRKEDEVISFYGRAVHSKNSPENNALAEKTVADEIENNYPDQHANKFHDNTEETICDADLINPKSLSLNLSNKN